MNKKIKILIGAIIVLIFMVVITIENKKNNITNTINTASKVEKIEIKIANLPIVQGLPIYLAVDKGYFKKEGLNVKIIDFQSPNQIVDALLVGKVDFVSPSGAMGIFGIVNSKKPGKLKIYAAAGGTDIVQNDSILVKKDSLIEDISELKNKKLGILPGIQWRIIAKEILAQNNLKDGDDVILVELAPGLQAQALASNQVDALLGVEPIPTIIKIKGIGKEIVKKATVKSISNPFYGGGGAVNVDFALKNPIETEKILKIIEKSIKEINDNPNEARKYLRKHTPLNDIAISNVPISKIKMYNDFTKKDIESIQKFYNIFKKHKVVEGKMNFIDLIYSKK